MKNINTVTLVGRLTRDSELKQTSAGFSILGFSIANNYSKKAGDSWEDQANFFNCKMFGKRAESLAQYMTKGQQVAVSGELRQERWEQEGQTRSSVVIIVHDVELIGGKDGNKDIPF